MSTDDETVRDEGSKPTALDYEIALHGRSVDWFLQELVDLMNQHENNETSVTLQLAGATLSGQLIHARRYFREAAAALGESGWNPEMVAWLDGQGSLYDTPDPRAPNYLHMREAVLVGADGSLQPVGQGGLWRGRINAVSGFSFGRLQRSEPIATE